MNVTIVSLILFLCVSFYYARGYKCENDARNRRSDYCSYLQYEQNISLCQTANLKIIPFADSDKKSITVSFTLNDTKTYENCFPFFDIFLVNKADNLIKACKLFAYDFSGKNYSHTFKDVSPGLYDIDIQPCYTKECCANLTIYNNNSINLTSYEMLNYTSEAPKNNSAVIYIIISVAVGAVLIIFGVYYICSIYKQSNITEIANVEEDSILVKPVIYVLHYYDNLGINKQKVGILKDFLNRSSLCLRVNTIEDELPSILNNVHSWLDDILKERSEDGKVQKIILIDSKEEDEEEAIENLIFNYFTDKLSDNLIQYLSSYNNLFVVQMDGISGHSDKLKNIVRRHRYRIPKHSVELCLNLCSVSESHVSSIKKHLQELLIYHSIKNLN